MSLLENRLKKDRQSLEDAEARVESMASIRPTGEESQKVGAIIDSVSSQYSDIIAAKGLTQKIKDDIKEQVEKEIQAVSDNYEERSRIRKLVLTSMFGLGPLEQYQRNPGQTRYANCL